MHVPGQPEVYAVLEQERLDRPKPADVGDPRELQLPDVVGLVQRVGADAVAGGRPTPTVFGPFSAVFGRFRAVSRPRATYLPPHPDALTPEWGYLPTPTGLPHLTTLPWRKYATLLS